MKQQGAPLEARGRCANYWRRDEISGEKVERSGSATLQENSAVSHAKRKASSPLIFDKNTWDSTDRSTSVTAILEAHVQPGCGVLNDSELSSVQVGFTDSWIDLRAVCRRGLKSVTL